MPRHGIAGVKQAHPAQYRWVGKERGRDIQQNWERFLRNNPGYRPVTAPRASPVPCLVHNIADESARTRCFERCIEEASRKRLGELLDHEEGWHVVHEDKAVPVLFGHPYLVSVGYPDDIVEFLQDLPQGVGERLAIYMCEGENAWYTVPTEGLFIQSRRLPPPRGWFEVTVDGGRWIPQPEPAQPADTPS